MNKNSYLINQCEKKKKDAEKKMRPCIPSQVVALSWLRSQVPCSNHGLAALYLHWLPLQRYIEGGPAEAGQSAHWVWVAAFLFPFQPSLVEPYCQFDPGQSAANHQ
jgi:hypothetical protein